MTLSQIGQESLHIIILEGHAEQMLHPEDRAVGFGELEVLVHGKQQLPSSNSPLGIYGRQLQVLELAREVALRDSR